MLSWMEVLLWGSLWSPLKSTNSLSFLSPCFYLDFTLEFLQVLPSFGTLPSSSRGSPKMPPRPCSNEPYFTLFTSLCGPLPLNPGWAVMMLDQWKVAGVAPCNFEAGAIGILPASTCALGTQLPSFTEALKGSLWRGTEEPADSFC